MSTSSPFRASTKTTKYPNPAIYYIKQIAEKKGFEFEQALPLIEACGDSLLAWSGDDNDKQDYLDDVDRALSRYLDGQRPEMKAKRNSWSMVELQRMNVIRSAKVRLRGAQVPEANLDATLCRIWNIPSLDNLHLFEGNQDNALNLVTRYAKEHNMPKAATSLPLWTEKHERDFEELMQANGIPATFVIGVCQSLLGGSPADVSATRHPDSILDVLKNGIAGWKRDHAPALGGQQSLLPVEVDKKDDDPLAGLTEGAKKLQALIDEDAMKANGASAELPLEAIKKDYVIDDKPERIELHEEDSLDGCEYVYDAAWSPNSWYVTFKSYVRLNDEQKLAIFNKVSAYLKLSKDSPVVFDWQITEPALLRINELRDYLDEQIRNAWPEWDNEQSINERAVQLKEILKVQSTLEALRTYGFARAQKLVHEAASAKLMADLEAKKKQQELERQQAEQRALVPQVALVPANGDRSMGLFGEIKLPNEYELKLITLLAKSAAASKLYPNITTFDQAFMILWRGFELGVSLGAALEKIWVIKGRVYPGTEILLAAVEASKKASRFDVIGDERQFTVTAQRLDRGPQVFTFTMADAEKAGLLKKKSDDAGDSNWVKYPKRMLKWRAVREAIQTVFPDVAAGVGLSEDDESETSDLPQAASF